MPEIDSVEVYQGLHERSESALDDLYMASEFGLGESALVLSDAVTRYSQAIYEVGICAAGFVDYDHAYFGSTPRMQIPFSRQSLPNISLMAQSMLSNRIAIFPQQGILSKTFFFSTDRSVHDKMKRNIYGRYIAVPTTPGRIATGVALGLFQVE